MKDNQPITDAEIEALRYQELMMAYLVRKLAPEQQQRILERLKQLPVEA